MDPYTLLGVARTASTVQIERAYRRLARRYHPDINPGDRLAADLYRQIEEAYRILADAEARHAYDRGGVAGPAPELSVAFEGFDFSGPAEGPLAATFSELFAGVLQTAAREAAAPARGADIEATLDVPFVDAARGRVVPLTIARSVTCEACGGRGRVSRAPVSCPDCGGLGAHRAARGHMVFARACDTCEGTGRLMAEACRACRGRGATPVSDDVQVTIPAGVETGTRLAVPGAGHAGTRGEPGGDLYITVRVAPHPLFERRGRDLYLKLPLALHEAVLGARIDVPTLDGTARLRVPPGTGSARHLRIAGRGLPPGPSGDPPAGDLILDVQLVVPPVLDERSKALLREFGEINGADVRQEWTR